MRTPIEPIVIFSADLSLLTDEQNKLKRDYVKFRLDRLGVPFIKVQGAYKGTKEHSFLVHGSNLKAAQDLAKLTGQESILVRDEDGVAFLEYQNGTRERLGHMVAVSKDEALASDAYTYRPDLNTYYIVK